MKRLYLDSNIYDHVCKAGEQDEFDSWLRRKGYVILLSGEHLQEALPIPDVGERRALLSLLTRVPRDYLDPSGYLHAKEVLSEIRRTRPEWLARFPDRTSIDFFLKGSKRQWIRAKLAPDRVAEIYKEYYRPVAEPAVGALREAQKSNRKALRKGADRLDGFWLGQSFVVTPTARLDDEEMLWRTNCLVVWHNALFKHPEYLRDYPDYLLPYLKGLPAEVDFIPFWLDAVERGPLRRNVIVSLVNHAQLDQKISHGNAVDALHASYIFDSDYFVTADRGFHEALKSVAASMGAIIPLLADRAAPSAVAELQRLFAERD
jgi:hypothetical protein